MGCCWGRATERQAAPRTWRPLPGREDSSRGQMPHGLWAEVPVASVSLPVKWEQGFPEVLLAFSVRCLLCFLRGGRSLPKSGPGGSAPPSPAQPSCPRWRGPVQALAFVQRPRQPGGCWTLRRGRGWRPCSGGCLQTYGPPGVEGVERRATTCSRTSSPLPGQGPATLPFLPKPFLCWCLGPKVEWGSRVGGPMAPGLGV